jgi:hypothetical protein
MAETFIREAINGSDQGVWGPHELAQDRRSLGDLTAQIYDDSGTLKLSIGKIGFDQGATKGTIEVDAIKTISIAGVSNGNWAKVEAYLSTGTTVVIEATDITGATTSTTLPSDFTTNYDGAKGGFYITATKRCIGLIWKTSGGSLSGVVNCLEGLEAYHGKSEDASFFKLINDDKIQNNNIVVVDDSNAPYTVQPDDSLIVLKASGVTANVTVVLPPIAGVQGKKFYFRNLNTTYKLTIDGDGAETLESCNSFEIFAKYDYTLGFIASTDEWKRTERQFVTIPEDSRNDDWILSAGSAVAWTDVNFSTWVPVGAITIEAKHTIRFTGDGALDTGFASFRIDGSTEADLDKLPKLDIFYTNLGAALLVGQQDSVPLDVNPSTLILEYQVNDADTDVWLNVMGFYI